MQDTSISNLILQIQKGNKDVFSLLVSKMLPLLKKYAKQLHYNEFDDSMQELTLTLYSTIMKMKVISSDGECVNYIQKSIKNQFYILKEKSTKLYSTELIQEEIFFSQTPYYDHSFHDLIFKLDTKTHLCFPKKIHRKIFYLLVYHELSDHEIATILHVSRQYINREKKQLFSFYLENIA